ncbi:MAG: hypothetical protein F9K37_02250 [Bacteroidales bacterium]|nr:MAG: hypothetical protein F9K37_02250 [Bacteroidales bacterium]
MKSIFTREHRMADLVLSDYNLLPIINRFGIRLGFRDKTVEQICKERNVNSEFFLAIINTYINPDYLPDSGLINVPVNSIVDYLQQTHRYYIEYTVPEIERLLSLLLKSSNTQNLHLIEKFYLDYKVELIEHIQNEESQVFPYVLNLVNDKFRKVNYSIHSFEREHTDLDEKLSDLRNLIIKYLEPTYNDNFCNDFLLALQRFEDDLKDHARIEDKILVPVVAKIEEELNG